jgi:hypothetical protein
VIIRELSAGAAEGLAQIVKWCGGWKNVLAGLIAISRAPAFMRLATVFTRLGRLASNSPILRLEATLGRAICCIAR